MSFEIDVALQTPGWEKAIPGVETLAHDVLSKTLTNVLPKHKELEVSLVLADDAFIRDLNKNYRGKDKATNVLSFPMTEADDLEATGFLSLGDIIIALETMTQEAKDQGKTLQDHFTHMLIHGCLHLLHYDHETEDEAKAMESLEIHLLNGFGIKNPYETE